ncbi:MAG: hypothetical protein PHU64_01775 [Candidatus Omnitrophica bacterium]|nr:hypothetical protein [Candidatus Omnitrophota bacterium]MDD5429233.1 hypothetical protein [Candidatus Omnitrophota bacterium]
MKRTIILVFLAYLVGCGYTTRGGIYAGKEIIIKPVVNKIDVASENAKTSGYTSFPVLIENRLTNELVSRFNVEGQLKVVSQGEGALSLVCTINDYDKETLRYEDNDDVKEQRLRLHILMILTSAEGEVLEEKTIVGESSYYLSGPNQRSETAAQNDLIVDSARRISEAVAEEW